MTAKTPGQAAYEAMHAARMERAPFSEGSFVPWDRLDETWGADEGDGLRREDMEAAAKAACEAHGHAVGLADLAVENARLRETIATAEKMTGIAIADWKRKLDAVTEERDELRDMLQRQANERADSIAELAARNERLAAERNRYADMLQRIANGTVPATGAQQAAYDVLDGAVPGPDTVAGLALDLKQLREGIIALADQAAADQRACDEIVRGMRPDDQAYSATSAAAGVYAKHAADLRKLVTP